MLSRRRSSVRPTMLAAAVLVAGAACSGTDEPDEPEPDAFDDGAVAADSAGSVGTDTCDLPLTFDIAADWAAEGVSADTADEFVQGGLRPVCEVSGHDAGWIAFVRVWQGSGDDPEQALEDFVADSGGEIVESDSRTVRVAGTDAYETSYVHINPLDERSPGRAFALDHGDGVVVVGLSGFDAEEHDGAMPAYVLARDTAELTG